MNYLFLIDSPASSDTICNNYKDNSFRTLDVIESDKPAIKHKSCFFYSRKLNSWIIENPENHLPIPLNVNRTTL